ncbi:MAG: hypothetical protein HKM04_02850 [Legionellales bacterium]|nr:hypothetical protein [Legionellales bacterium]
MKLLKTLSLTAMTALSAAGCTSMMNTNSHPAPVDTMNVNSTAVTPSAQTTTSTTVTSTTGKPVGTTVANSASTMVGGSIGSNVGKAMDDSDNTRVNQVLETQKTGQTSAWTNANSNTSYTLTPTRTYTSSTGEPCRDFTVSALISGKTQQVYGSACRDPSAQWHVISS